MRIECGRVELSLREMHLLRLASCADPAPLLEVEGFAEWMLLEFPENLPAVRHGAHALLREALVKAFEAPRTMGGSQVVVLTRHPGVLAWLLGEGIRPTTATESLNLTDLRAGDQVVGILPVGLAGQLQAMGVDARHIHVPLAASCDEGLLGPSRLRLRGARLERYDVCLRLGTPC